MAGYIGSKAVSVNTTSATITDDLTIGDDLTVTDDMTVGGTLGVTGVLTATSLDISGDIDVDGTTNLDAVDIDGAVNMATTALVTGVLTTTAATVFNGGFASADASTIIAADGAADNQFSLIIKNEEATDDRSYGLYIQAGSTVTDSPLHLYEHTGSTQLFRVTGTGQALFTDGSASLPSITNIGDTNTGIFFPAADTIAFAEGGSEAMRIENGGQVGINVNNPSSFNSGAYNLVVGSPSATSQGITIAADENAIMYFADGTSGAEAYMGSIIYNHSDNNMTFRTNGFNSALVIASDQSVSTPTAGTSNVRLGVNAGNSIASGGNYNVCIGDEAGTAISTGTNNVAVGYAALYQEDGHGRNVAVGKNALYTLNAGTNAANTAVGYEAGVLINTGILNTLIGGAVGDALTDADKNTAVGYTALSTDQKGSQSTAIGYQALFSQNFTTATDSFNTAVGYNAGAELTTAVGCTFIGHAAGANVTTGNTNTFVGNSAGIGTSSNKLTGAENTVVGQGAGQDLQGAANKNTLIGRDTGSGLTTGFENLMVGYAAGDALTTGNNNIMIGMSVDPSAVDQTNGIAIGVGITAGANDFAFGKASNVVFNDFDTDASWSRISDERLKKNIVNSTLGLSFINDLRTVKYKWKASDELDASDSQLTHRRRKDDDGNIINDMNTDVTMHNFIAQEVKAALDTAGVSDFGGWKEDQYGVQQVSRDMFVIPLVKAVQELSTKLDAALARIATLEG